GEEGYALAHQQKYDLLILDIMLPKMNGIDICKAIRENDKQIPILFLTALGTSENISLGLNTGADDYLVKPFKFIEFLARIKSLLRRSASQNTLMANRYSFADLTIDDTAKLAMRSNQELTLTSTEYRLLLTFVKTPGKVFSRSELLEKVWGFDFEIGTNVVDVYVNYIRKKMELNGSPRLIQTVIGMGYVLKKNEDTD
ncbi:MAG: response regulator transcription factor, partial [Leeuwenhoekiella sp.]